MESYQGAPLDVSKFRSTLFTCAAVTLILPALAVVIFLMDLSGEAEDFVSPMTIGIFAILTGIECALAPLIRARTLRPTGAFRNRNGQIQEGEEAAVSRISQAAIVGMAMPEIASMLGFVLTFMSGGEWLYLLAFGSVSVGMWIYMFPRPAQLQAWYAHQMGYEPAPSIIH